MTSKRLTLTVVLLVTLASLMLYFSAIDDEPVSESRFVEPDRLFMKLESNVRGNAEFETIVGIDHARLAAEAGSPMPPSRVLIWSDPYLEAVLLRQNPLVAIDLPLRVLAYENPETGSAAVIANSFDFVANRYSLAEDEMARSRYESNIARSMAGIAPESVARFQSDSMADDGLVRLSSPFDFATTRTRILEAIQSQSDTIVFGEMDFTARSLAHGVTLDPLALILFGAPGPGGKVMASAPTLGLDAFCQKLLIWRDAGGAVHVVFNDLVALAERQQVAVGVPLRVVNRRLRETFASALAQ